MKDEKAEVYIRVLDDNHRVCIPIQVRQEMEVSPGCSIEFLADGDRIILRKYGQEMSCIFCGGTRKARLFRGRIVCSVCQRGLLHINKGVVPSSENQQREGNSAAYLRELPRYL